MVGTSPTEQRLERERDRRLAALLVERFGPLSTLHLERRHYVPIPERAVRIHDTPDRQARRRAALEAATEASQRAGRARDDLLDTDDLNRRTTPERTAPDAT